MKISSNPKILLEIMLLNFGQKSEVENEKESNEEKIAETKKGKK